MDGLKMTMMRMDRAAADQSDAWFRWEAEHDEQRKADAWRRLRVATTRRDIARRELETARRHFGR